MCRVPDQEDAKYKDDEDAYEDDLEEMQTKTDAIKPKKMPSIRMMRMLMRMILKRCRQRLMPLSPRSSPHLLPDGREAGEGLRRAHLQ